MLKNLFFCTFFKILCVSWLFENKGVRFFSLVFERCTSYFICNVLNLSCFAKKCLTEVLFVMIGWYYNEIQNLRCITRSCFLGKKLFLEN